MRKQKVYPLIAIAIAVMVAIIAISGCGKKEAPPAAPTKIDFATSYDGALKLAQEKNQKVLIDFYTDWCTWCKKLDTETYVDSAVIALSQNLVFTKINAEVDTVTAAKYMVRAYPTIVLMNNDGTEIDRIAGYLPAQDFIQTVDDYLHGINTLDYFLKKEADSGANIELNATIAQKYADRGMYPEAEQYLQKVLTADPDNAQKFGLEAMMSLGDIKMRDKKYDEAYTIFKNVMTKFATSDRAPEAHIYSAIVLARKGDTTAAIKAFESFIKTYPTSEDTAYAQKQIERLKNPEPPETAK
ncbi:conserved exported hypothetical protein [Candidatus Zixiibacteriota bacterium]|nr:conserved exported hypothetical protein [candidate division Zixibacteria bacterium]